MVSLPVSVADSSVATLFPTKITNAFLYDTSGYNVAGSMSIGRGYWLKFSGDQVVTDSGPSNSPLVIPVRQGWNLIGSQGVVVQTSNISSSPPGIVTSQFFGYQGSYQTSTTIQPGRAYWVKVNQAGGLILSASGATPSAAKIKIVATTE